MMAYSQGVSGNGPGPQGICPTGWHIPTDNEWKCLEMNLGMTQAQADQAIGWRGADEGGKLKETGMTHWSAPNAGATNSSEFTALPGYYVAGGSNFSNPPGTHAYFWSATEESGNSQTRTLYNLYAQIGRAAQLKTNGYSVRCIKD